jgi:GTP:adenosylcobinamide-phosphate guanylyltransferase
MAGGMGKRMSTKTIKPLLVFRGKPLIAWIYGSAFNCPRIESTYVAITQYTAELKELLDAEYVITGGEGYVNDMVEAIKRLGLKRTLTLSADLPFITPSDLTWVVEEYLKLGTPALAVYVHVKVYEDYELDYDLESNGLVPSGVNVVNGSDIDGRESRIITENPAFAFNINTQNNLEKAIAYARKS